jgi:hypothetical protein
MKKTFMTALLLGILVFLIASTGFGQIPRVNVMPGSSPGNVYPISWPGRDMVIWGNVNGGTAPYIFTWEFGDGSPSIDGAVANPKYIAVNHIYATTGPKYAVLTVTDATMATDVDTVIIAVELMALDVEINATIEDGLRYLYLQQWADGRWQDLGCDVATTAMAVLAFENQEHRPINDYNRDIYAEYVKAGLDFLTSLLVVQALDIQTAGNPEEIVPGNADGNGLGVYPNSCYPPYEIGMVMMAFVGAGKLGTGGPNLIAPNGPADVVGRTYRDLVIDMVDYCAWAQNDEWTGCSRGGWRYSANYSSSDNSVSQWPTIGLEAAETFWQISSPSFVKSELLYWINATQINSPGNHYDGAFYYDCYGSFYRDGMPSTGAGLCELSYCDVPKTDTRIQRTLGYLERMWGSGYNKGFYYSMYAIAKGCLIAVDDMGDLSKINFIGSIAWYPDYARYLVDNQYADGSWPTTGWGDILDDSWAILVLQKTIGGGDPVAVISAPPSVPPSMEFPMDGSHSFHEDTSLNIIQWLWDFDNSDGKDWNNPDAIGQFVTNPGYALDPGDPADTIVVTLRVIDDGGPVKTDEEERLIIVDYNNHPPHADAGGPYAAKIGDIIAFDGSASSDPDSGDYIASYAWDIDGDAEFDDCFDVLCYNSWDFEYSGSVHLLVVDSYGDSSWDTSSVKVWTSQVDIGLAAEDISFSNPNPKPGDLITITAVIHCDINSDPVSDGSVRFYDGDPDISVNQIDGDQIIPSMIGGDAIAVQVQYTVGDTLPREIYVKADPDGIIEEFNENNNKAFKSIVDLIPTNEWVNLYCLSATLNGEIIPEGSIIEAYDPSGVLCGRDVVMVNGMFGFMPVYRDDPWSIDVDEGALPGDTITFAIDGIESYAKYPIIWTGNGDKIEVCEFTSQICIPLDSGWNLISWNVDTKLDDIAVLAADVMSNVNFILSFEYGGVTYDPTLPEFSTLLSADHFHGYWFNMMAPDTLCVSGPKAPLSTPIYMESGWNLVSYLPDYPMFVPDALLTIWDDVIVVLGYDHGGFTYDPNNPGFSTLDSMRTTFGYWVKTSASGVLSYDGTIYTIPAKEIPEIAISDVNISNQWMNLYGRDVTVNGQSLAGGSVIKAYDSNNNLVGKCIAKDNGQFGFMPIYNDQATAQTYRLTINDEEITETVDWTHHGAKMEISALTTPKNSNAMIPADFVLYQNSPNPFNPVTEISFALPVASNVILDVFNIAGQKVATIADGYYEAGDHTVIWNGESDNNLSVASGVYLYRMKAGVFVDTKKMMLLK